MEILLIHYQWPQRQLRRVAPRVNFRVRVRFPWIVSGP